LTPRQGEFFKVVLGLTILVAAAGASSWYLAWPHGEPFARDNPSRIPARDVPKKSRLYPLVQQYDNAASPEEQLAALMGMWRVKLSWVEEERELEQWWRERLRWKYLEELNRTFEELQKTAQGEQLAAQRGVALATALTALRDCPAHPLLVEQERSWFKGCSEWLKEHKVLLDK